MIDIHSHLLPGMDDGAQNADESISIAQAAYNAGFQTIVATPHVATSKEFESFGRITARIHDLQLLLDANGLPINILPGAEVFPSDLLIPALSGGNPPSIAESSYILIGLPLLSTPINLGQVLFEAQSRGFRPVLAHPERVIDVQQNPDSLLQYLERGILLQLNAGSITGYYGKQAMATAHVLLKHRWAHFLASDAHSRGAFPRFQAALLQITSRYGKEMADALAIHNPRLLLSNAKVPSDPFPYSMETNAVKRFWNLFMRKP
jgi:protein-tyrosine phosphatase